MYSFFAFAFKAYKKCYYDPKRFFCKKYQYEYQINAEFYADYKFVDAGIQKNSKTHAKMRKNENTQNLHNFLATAPFLGAFVSIGSNEFENSIKFCDFLYLY